jgi:hypothetical protein
MKATGRCVQYSSPHGNGHQNGQQSGYMLHHYCVDYCPGGCQGNTEQVVTQWWHPVTSGEALGMLHQAMRSRLHRRTTMASKWPAMEVHSFAAALIVAQHHVMVH